MDKDKIREIKEKLDAFLTEFLRFGGSIAVAYALIEILVRALNG